MEVLNTSGRRKTAVARIYMQAGNGNIVINNKPYDQYFTTLVNQFKVVQPLQVTDNVGKLDIKINVDGGGITGQAEAVRLAISKSLCDMNTENRTLLKPLGL
jgi:small subunit ribosomal protein S9